MAVGTEFGLAREVYRRFRPDYPRALYERIFAELPGRKLAVDLGAGTGLVSAVLVERFDRVIAVEPDAEMAEELREAAPRVEHLAARAEQAELPRASADLVCCANAFHWMDGPKVTGVVQSWLGHGGLFAGWRYPFPEVPGALEELIEREMAARWAAFRDPAVLDMDSLARCVEAEPALELILSEEVANPVRMDAGALLGFVRSTSFGAAYLRSLDARERAAYLSGLEAEIASRMGGPSVELDLRLRLVLGRRR